MVKAVQKNVKILEVCKAKPVDLSDHKENFKKKAFITFSYEEVGWAKFDKLRKRMQLIITDR